MSGFILVLWSAAAVWSGFGICPLFCLQHEEYAPYLLAFASLCMTYQVSWHWQSHVAQVKDSLM